ncbi:MAG TPA: glycosyltransferase family A protein [Mucilaginibacter sp.]|nr:glycosyltransferase family A protein [Mucilaginibacter sp.]
MNTDKPLVSVIVPSYNHEKFITKCIESIIKQTYKNFELTVIDDGSKDDSPRILKDLQKKYGFGLVFQQNIGLALTLNRGIKEYSRGKYYSSCSSDDYWLPDKLEKQVDFLEKNPEYPMCFGRSYVVDQSGEVIQSLTDIANDALKGGYIFEDIILQKFNPPVNFMFRRSIFDEVGYYKDTWAEDLYMNLKISEKYPLGFINDYLGYYRSTGNNKDIHKAKVVSRRTFASHLDSINEFKDSVYYKAALKNWYLRCFYWYCRYTETKKDAASGMIRNLDSIFKKQFLKAVFKLIFIWD